MKFLKIILVISFISLTARAEDYVEIADASQIVIQAVTGSSDIYFRNLDQFHSGFAGSTTPSAFKGCCYNYWIDTSTGGGKNAYAYLLMRMALHQNINISVPSAAKGGLLNMFGPY